MCRNVNVLYHLIQEKRCIHPHRSHQIRTILRGIKHFVYVLIGIWEERKKERSKKVVIIVYKTRSEAYTHILMIE